MNELTKNLVCVVMRNGIEVWLESERADQLVQLLTSVNVPQFIKYEDRLLNKADITGVFTAKDMEEMKRRKNGEWLCHGANWHQKGEHCACLDVSERRKLDVKWERVRSCKNCVDGWIKTETGVSMCACQV